MFTRLDVVRMFIEHTCPPEDLNHTDDGRNALKLWKVRFLRHGLHPLIISLKWKPFKNPLFEINQFS